MHTSNFKINSCLPVLSILLIAASCSPAKLNSQIPASRITVLEIISDAVIWSKNVFLAIAQTEALEKEGRKSLDLFSSSIVSRERYAPNQQDSLNQKITSSANSLFQ